MTYINIFFVLFFAFFSVIVGKSNNLSFFPWYRNLSEESKEKINIKPIKLYCCIGSAIIAGISLIIFCLSLFVTLDELFYGITYGIIIFTFLIIYLFKVRKIALLSKYDFLSAVFILIFVMLVGLSKYF